MTTLNAYLTQNNISVSEFAESLGSKRGTVYNWIAKRRVPNAEYQKKIFEMSNGEVTPNDFYLD